MKLKSISLVIILGGILFSLYLQTQVADGVYFSGDGGLKALLAKQLAEGKFRFDLASPEQAWVSQLWNAGLYPYDEPYVYQVAAKYYITFPYTFPLVTAPFYAWFGYRGLYLIPLISCWVIWLVFYLDCLKLKLSNWVTALGLVCLIFSSYLTIYSAMYWEHPLAVALAFSGLSLWFFFDRERPSIIKSIISGVLIGLSVWFRPEFICLVAIIIALAILNLAYWKRKNLFAAISFPLQQQLLLIFSMLLTVASFFVSNKIIYGYAVGIHGIQAVESISFSDRIINTGQNLTAMSSNLVEYLPIIIIPLIFLISYLVQKIFFCSLNIIQFPTLYCLVYLAIIAFIFGVSVLVPVGTSGLIPGGKQWGVRFLLMLVPVVTLLACLELEQLITQKKLKYLAIAITVILIIFGIQKNIVEATESLQENNQVTVPAVEYLQRDTNQYIAISHEFVGQALEAATVDREIFFTVDTPAKLIQLAQSLIQQQQNRFTYICYPHRACKLPKLPPRSLQFQYQQQTYQIEFQKSGKFGKYPIYKVIISLFLS